ncbi:MAG: DNA polymerase III subunit [Planctomycetaceae bacterium]|jgi:DNA polymerase-3 subunit delta'|nr:DNA polymerase III subunit [Planctomycetaceae bacterium]
MAWQEIQGHDVIFERFRSAHLRGRLSGSFLFIGVSGIGKKRFAFALAKSLLCKGESGKKLEPCGECESCKIFEADSQSNQTNVAQEHPDFFYIAKPEDKSFIPLEYLIGSKDRRGEEGFCFDISRTPYVGNRKIAVIDDADYMNAEGANAILKTLEEPPADSVIILIGTSIAKQLPTIRSRCRVIRFSPLPPRVLAALLLKNDIVATLDQGLSLARRSGGSFDLAKELGNEAIDKIRAELDKYFSNRNIDTVQMAAQINTFVEEAGKEASLRRKRLRVLLNVAINHFIEDLKKSNSNESMKLAAERLNYTLDATEQVGMNANLPYIVDAWCDKL